MKIYLACTAELKKEFAEKKVIPEDIYVLESFYSISEWQKPLVNRFKGFLLDSGAFTFLNANKSKKNVDFERYADAYADFIKSYKIKRYFELDIDPIVGLKEVERLRNRIENRVGWQSIPVWHLKRGKEYFLQMVKDYKYVAIGGIVTKEIKTQLYEKLFPWFIQTAHKNCCMIHGLGYTSIKGLYKYHFDSVDSSTWANATRFGEVHIFRNGIIKRIGSVEKNKKVRSLKDPIKTRLLNVLEWEKFQKFANNNL